MKTVTNEFKEQIKKLGREIDFKIFLYANNKIITENNNFLMTEDNMNLVVQQFNEEEVEQTITSEDIFNVSIINKGELLSTMIKEIDLEIRQELKIGDVIDCQFGLKVGEEYEYVDYGKYMIYSKEYNEDTKSYNYVAFDRMLLTMQEASQDFLKNLEGKTLADCINIICNIVGLNYNATQEELETYPNLSKKINEGTFTDIQMTYRDVIDMISQALGLSMIVEGKELKLKKLAEIKNKEETIIGKNNLYIENAKEQENIISYSVDGATEQDGTPTPDNPVEVKTIPSIMNLFDKDNANTFNGYLNSSNVIIAGGTQTGIYISCKSNTTYTITKENTGENNRFCVFTTDVIPEIGVTALNYVGTRSGANDNAYYTITTPSNAKYLCVFMRIASTTPTLQEILDSIQIKEGSVAHEYVPYGYWSKVKVTGKNMFGFNKSAIDKTSTYRTTSQQRLTITATDDVNEVKFNYGGGSYCRGYFEIIGIDGTLPYTISFNVKENTTSYTPVYTIDTTNSTTNKLVFFINGNNGSTATSSSNYFILSNIQLEQGETATTYEPYKENQVLIDMSKENLFDKDNYNYINAYFNSSGTNYMYSNAASTTIYISCKPNTTYTIQKIEGKRFAVGYTTETPVINTSVYGAIGGNSTATYYTITTGNNAQYLVAFVNNTNVSGEPTLQQVLDSIKIYESNNPTPYYELCKIGDYKDTLSIDSSGNVVVNKNVGKVVFNGSENWYINNNVFNVRNISDYMNTEAGVISTISNYYKATGNVGSSANAYSRGNNTICLLRDNTTPRIYIRNDSFTTTDSFKAWLSTHNTDVYYVLATPETINLPNTKIPLFEGINHVTFVDDLETDTSITYTSQELADMEEINEQYLKDTNVSFGEKYMINSVVLSRSEDTDTIYRRDEESITKNGVHEFKIKDNLIMLYDDREDYIDEIFEQLNGLEYYVNDFSSTGITYLDWLDFYNVSIGDKTYKCLMLNDEIKINQGLEETIYTEEPEETVTDYKTSSKTDKEVSFIVDKQNGKIRGQVSKDDIIASLNVAIENGQGIVELKGNSVVIESDNFTLDEEGNAKMSSVEINHGKMKLYDESSEGTEIWPEFSIESGDGTYYNDSENKIWSNLIQIISKYQGNTLAALGLRRGSPYMLLEELNFITSLLAGEILLRNDTTNATTQILPGMIIINDGQGHSKTITPTN